MRNASLDFPSWQHNDSEESPMQSIPPRKKHCCRNARPHGNAEDAATASSMDVGKLAYKNTQNARMGLYARLEERLPFCREKPYRCCRCACHAELTVSSGTARPSVQTDSNLPVVATYPHGAKPAPPAGKHERCPPP